MRTNRKKTARSERPGVSPKPPLVLPLKRTLWVYEAGWFEKVTDTGWIDVNRDVYNTPGDGKFEFEEVVTDDDFIELHDKSREIAIRLYAGQAKWHLFNQAGWYFIYDGRWRE